MNKSIYMFIGGSLFGVVAAVTLIKSNYDTPQQTPAVAQPTGMKVITAKMQADQMQQSAKPMESMSDMQVRLSQQDDEQDMMSMQNNQQAAMANEENSAPAQATKFATQLKNTTTVKVPVIPPTEDQVKQYQDMDNIIRTAANNPKVNLSELIERADNLTIEQRNQLTKTALGMLDRGELSIEQFAKK